MSFNEAGNGTKKGTSASELLRIFYARKAATAAKLLETAAPKLPEASKTQPEVTSLASHTISKLIMIN